jgi:hypothetical protein
MVKLLEVSLAHEADTTVHRAVVLAFQLTRGQRL